MALADREDPLTTHRTVAARTSGEALARYAECLAFAEERLRLGAPAARVTATLKLGENYQRLAEQFFRQEEAYREATEKVDG